MFAMRVLTLLLTLIAVFALIAAASAAEGNLIQNGDFELGADDAGVPLFWTPFSGVGNVDFVLTEERASSGATAVKLIDTDAGRSVGLRSQRVEAKPGQRFVAVTDVYIEAGTAMFYLDFLDAAGQRVNAFTASTSAAQSWRQLTVEGTAPEGTAYVTLIIYSSIPNVGTLYFDNVQLRDVSQQAAALVEREPTNREIGFRPADGSSVKVNPPPLVWLPASGAVSYIVELSQDPAFPAAGTKRVDGIDLPLYTPAEILDAGVWYWRYWAVDARGNASGPSQVRSFVITEGLPELPLPPTEEWMARIPSGHPRLFITPESLPELRARLNVRALPAVLTDGRLAALIGVDLPPEPPSPYASGALDIETWRAGLDAITPAFHTLEELAFLYVMTGEEAYGREGKKLLVHLASMDPSGATSYRGAPEVAMRMLYMLPRAYTWLYDALTEEEREIVRRSARLRGQEAYNMIKGLPFETSPYSSHPGRMLGFLGQLSIAFLDEIPEARLWLDYVVKLVFAVYPAWGGDDGGYSEGNNYWRAYMSWMFDFLDAFKAVTGIDLYQKPFFRNTGYFALYTHSVGTAQPFSDGQNGRTGGADQVVMTHLARLLQNPYFAWYVNNIGGMNHRSKIMALLTNNLPMPAAKPPTDLPDARWFRDVGWVALHRDLATPAENVQFTFKASPFGSASHSHSDQNAFVIYAYGDGLAISSGYYPWSRSPHHEQWTNQTLSKNTLLIDGKGQPIFDIEASGRILGLFHSGVYDYTAGEAAKAYANPDLLRFTRHVVYLRPDMFLLVDDVRARRPVTIDWLLHSRFPITWDEAAQTARIDGRNGRLTVRLIGPDAMAGRVSDVFNIPPEQTSYEKEWHLTASLTAARSESVIVALLVTGKTSGAMPEIVNFERNVAGDVVHVTIQHRTDGRLMTEQVWLRLPAAGAEGVAQVQAVAYDEAGQLLRALASGGAVTPEGVVSLTEGWSAAAAWDAARGTVDVYVGRTDAEAQEGPFRTRQGAAVELAAPFAPAAVTVHGHEAAVWSYDAALGRLRVEL